METIYKMQSMQGWMQKYRQELGVEELPGAGCTQGENDANKIADRIRSDFHISRTWQETFRNSREAFSYIRGQLARYGVLVMGSGKMELFVRAVSRENDLYEGVPLA